MRAADRWYKKGRTQYVNVRPFVSAAWKAALGTGVELHLGIEDGAGRFTVLMTAEEARQLATDLLRAVGHTGALAAECDKREGAV